MEGEHLQQAIAGKSDLTEKCPLKYLPPFLFDEHNCEWFDKARPIKWVDPEAHGKYDMVAIGGGAGGLVTCIVARALGAGKVAMIERSLMGGDCLNSGCVPSKAFLKSANVVHTITKQAQKFGVKIDGAVTVDFGAVMARMRKIRADIAEADSPQRMAETFGIDMFLGHAEFTGAN